jgi:hypothetical protein
VRRSFIRHFGTAPLPHHQWIAQRGGEGGSGQASCLSAALGGGTTLEMLHGGTDAPKQLILWRQQYLAWIERYREETNNVRTLTVLDFLN